MYTEFSINIYFFRQLDYFYCCLDDIVVANKICSQKAKNNLNICKKYWFLLGIWGFLPKSPNLNNILING